MGNQEICSKWSTSNTIIVALFLNGFTLGLHSRSIKLITASIEFSSTPAIKVLLPCRSNPPVESINVKGCPASCKVLKILFDSEFLKIAKIIFFFILHLGKILDIEDINCDPCMGRIRFLGWMNLFSYQVQAIRYLIIFGTNHQCRIPSGNYPGS